MDDEMSHCNFGGVESERPMPLRLPQPVPSSRPWPSAGPWPWSDTFAQKPLEDGLAEPQHYGNSASMGRVGSDGVHLSSGLQSLTACYFPPGDLPIHGASHYFSSPGWTSTQAQAQAGCGPTFAKEIITGCHNRDSQHDESHDGCTGGYYFDTGIKAASGTSPLGQEPWQFDGQHHLPGRQHIDMQPPRQAFYWQAQAVQIQGSEQAQQELDNEMTARRAHAAPGISPDSAFDPAPEIAGKGQRRLGKLPSGLRRRLMAKYRAQAEESGEASDHAELPPGPVEWPVVQDVFPTHMQGYVLCSRAR